MTRSAISPRLAIRTFRNMGPGLYLRHPVRSPPARGLRRARRRGAGLAFLGALNGRPQAIGGGGDPLELEAELVRVVAVPHRLFLGDGSLLQQRENRLIEGLHAV